MKSLLTTLNLEANYIGVSSHSFRSGKILKINRAENNDIVDNLKNFLDFKSGEIYQLSYKETPYFYTAKLNQPDSFKTLNIIRTID